MEANRISRLVLVVVQRNEGVVGEEGKQYKEEEEGDDVQRTKSSSNKADGGKVDSSKGNSVSAEARRVTILCDSLIRTFSATT